MDTEWKLLFESKDLNINLDEGKKNIAASWRKNSDLISLVRDGESYSIIKNNSIINQIPREVLNSFSRKYNLEAFLEAEKQFFISKFEKNGINETQIEVVSLHF